jgi:hypothetical protein
VLSGVGGGASGSFLSASAETAPQANPPSLRWAGPVSVVVLQGRSKNPAGAPPGKEVRKIEWVGESTTAAKAAVSAAVIVTTTPMWSR